MGIETEIKFEVSPADLQKLAASRSLRPSDGQLAEHRHMVSTYFDTPNHLLKRHGIRMSVVLPGFVETSMSDVFPGDKPFLWTANKAASYIRRKLEAGRTEVAFPGLLAFGMRLLPLLPPSLADGILDKLSYFPREEDVK